MLNLTAVLQTIDQIFTTFIFLPMIFILYCRFTGFHRQTLRRKRLYRFCVILVGIFLFRYFCGKFIYTEINYEKLSADGMSPVIKAIFYPGH